MTSKLVPWPGERPEHMGLANSAYWEAYERQRAEAAIARLKVAVQYMRGYQHVTGGDLACSEALALIGEIPSE